MKLKSTPRNKHCTRNSLIQKLTTASLLLFMLLSNASFAAGNKPEQNISEKLTMNMQQAEIGALIQWVADKTGKNFIIDPRVKGKVNVLASEPVTQAEAYQIFLSVLQVHGYAAVETEEAIKIIPETHAKSINVPLINKDSQAQGDEMIIRVLKINNIKAAQLVTLLRPLIPTGGGHIAAYPETNALIISDRASNIGRIINIINMIDEAGEINIEIIHLKFALAKDVINILKALVPESNATKGTAPRASAVQFVSDERTNSILMAGDPIVKNRVRNLIEHLDTQLDGGGNTQVIYLHYLKASEVLPILQSIGGSFTKEKKDSKDAKVDINVQASDTTNALVITAPPALLDSMKSVIAQLDIRRAQILVEAVIVEVTNDISTTLGVEWFTSEASRNDGFSRQTWGSGGDSVGSSTSSSDLSNLDGLMFGFYRNGSLRSLVNALAKDDTSNLLSTPSIVTLDNEEAEILVGNNIPIVTGRETSSSSATSNPFQTIERQDIGIHLKITPQINEGDAITLKISQEVSDVSLRSDDGVETSKKTINTTVLVEDDQILVLGGLMSDKRSTASAKVPLFGNLPLIGSLFKNESKIGRKQNLMVFIHPLIIKDMKNANEISKKRYNFMKEQQDELIEDGYNFLSLPKHPYLLDLDAVPFKSKNGQLIKAE